MELTTRTRSELKSYFVKNSIPTETNFAELIDGMLNFRDDGIVKLPDDPLSIQGVGDDASAKNAIMFYRNFADKSADWVLNLNPRLTANDPASAKPGLNISDGLGNTRLFIDRSSGNVGLGTIEPKATLDVQGSFRANQNVSGAGAILTEAPTNLNHRITIETNPETFQTGLVYRIAKNPASAAPIFQIQSEGRAVRFFAEHDGWTGAKDNSAWFGGNRLNFFKGSVGIGTQDPQGKLDVHGAIRAGNSDLYFTKVDHNHTGIGNTKGFAAIENSANHNTLMILGRAGTKQGRKVGIWDYLQVNGSMDVTGNLGIGDADPQQKLVVVANHNTGKEADSGMTYGGNMALKGNAPQLDFIDSDHNDWSIHVNSNKMYFIRQPWNYMDLVLDGAGNVGIGTDGPAAKLDVRGAIRAGNSDIYFTHTSHDHIGIGNTAGFAAIENAKNYDALMILGRAGTNKGRKVRLWDYLEVNGDLDVTGKLKVGGQKISADRIHSSNGHTLVMQTDRNLVIYSGGKAVWASNTWTSDLGLKERIQPIEGALDKVRQMNGVLFNWKDQERGTNQEIGLIAQDVEKVAPQLVSLLDDNKAVDYRGIIPILVEAVKTQQEQIETLQAAVKTLKH